MRHVRRQSKPGVRQSISKVRVAIGILAFFLAFVLVAWVLDHSAPEHASSETPFDILKNVSVLEMPDRTVAIVKVGDPDQLDERIQLSLKAVSVLARPGIMPSLVSRLVREFPDRLEVILDAAVNLHPELVLVYAKVCTIQLPAQMEQISYVLGRKTPWNAAAIAKTLAVETSDPEAIIRGLRKGIPAFGSQSQFFQTDQQTNAVSQSAGAN